MWEGIILGEKKLPGTGQEANTPCRPEPSRSAQLLWTDTTPFAPGNTLRFDRSPTKPANVPHAAHTVIQLACLGGGGGALNWPLCLRVFHLDAGIFVASHAESACAMMYHVLWKSRKPSIQG